MRFLKFLYLIISILTGSFTLSSCLGDEPEAFFPTLGTVCKEKQQLLIESDNYGLLSPVNSHLLSTMNMDSTGQRVFMNIRFTDEEKARDGRQVEIRDLYKVLTKATDDLRIAGHEEESVFGDTPIQITSSSISEEHLNIQFMVWGSSNNISHEVSLLLNEESQLDEEGFLPVSLRHNANGDEAIKEFLGIASFTLSSIPEYRDPRFKGFRIYYNSGANIQAVWSVQKTNSKLFISGR